MGSVVTCGAIAMAVPPPRGWWRQYSVLEGSDAGDERGPARDRGLCGEVDVDDQTAVRGVGRADGAAVQADRPVRDREPQTHAAASVLTRLADAIERLEDERQRLLGDAAAVIANGDPHVRRTVLIEPAHDDLHVGAIGRVANGVADHVLHR